jgi:hypothetical protein
VIDTGYRAIDIFNWCLRQRILVMPVKGEKGKSTSQTKPARAQRIGQYPGGK